MSFTNSGRIKVTPTYVVEYNIVSQEAGKGCRPQSNISSGYLSYDSMKKVRERINYMVYIAKNKTLRKSINLPVTNYKLVFITCTLSAVQIHSDKVIKEKLLQPLLRILRNRWKVGNYLWKAESQDNGNIHFHIITDKYVHWEDLKNTWNTIQETLGYITRSNSSNPNSTDIHAIYKKRNPASYIAGYIAKKDWYKKETASLSDSSHYYSEVNNITACDCKTREEVGIKRGIEGKIYDCNHELKKIKAVWESNYGMSYEIEAFYERGNKRVSDSFFKVQFIDSLNDNDSILLKTLLDLNISRAYGTEIATDEESEFSKWIEVSSKKYHDAGL
jgi:hypothetical protein